MDSIIETAAIEQADVTKDVTAAALLKDGGPCGKCGCTLSHRWRGGKEEYAGTPCCSKRQCKIFLKVEKGVASGHPYAQHKTTNTSAMQKRLQLEPQQAGLPETSKPSLTPPTAEVKLDISQSLVALLTNSLDQLARTFEEGARLSGVPDTGHVLAALQNAAVLAQERMASNAANVSKPHPAPMYPTASQPMAAAHKPVTPALGTAADMRSAKATRRAQPHLECSIGSAAPEAFSAAQTGTGRAVAGRAAPSFARPRATEMVQQQSWVRLFHGCRTPATINSGRGNTASASGTAVDSQRLCALHELTGPDHTGQQDHALPPPCASGVDLLSEAMLLMS